MSSLKHIVKSLVSLALVLTIALSGGNVVKRSRLSASNSQARISESHLPALLTIANPTPLLPNPEKRKSTAPVEEAYGKLPLSFEANQGQVESRVKFLSRGKGYSLYLTPTEALFQLPIAEPLLRPPLPSLPRGEFKGVSHRQSSTLRMQLFGANPHALLRGLDELPGKSNYLTGNDPKKWLTNISTYSKVRYQDVYPGIDLVFYGNQRQLEYDFVVAPGADPKTIQLSFEGQEKLEIGEDGELLLHTAGGEIRQPKPLVYQEAEGQKQPIPGHYVLRGSGPVGFQVDGFDPSRPLIIDPELVYSTYLGGNGSEEYATGIAVDSQGNAYVAGTIASTDFPTTTGALQTTYGGGSYDAFVTKLSPSGSLIYSTYLGTSGGELVPSILVPSIAIDNSGNAYLAGSTYSSDFPTTAGALQRVIGGANDLFISKLNAAGSALVYSTFLGGDGLEEPTRIVVDASGNAYVSGSTRSSNFPTTAAAFQRTKGAGDAEDGFVAKINPQGSALVYSTFLGGSQPQSAFGVAIDMAIDAAGNAYITGLTDSLNFPTTPGAFQKTLSGAIDVFITKINPQGSALVYSTFLGGSDDEIGWGITTDSAGNAYVTGLTRSADFPTLKPLQETKGCGSDVFVTKINSAGSALLFSTFLGGGGGESAQGIALDSLGNAYVAGTTTSVNFPVTADAMQATLSEGLCSAGTVREAFLVPCSDVFVAKLNATGTALLYSSYLGGSGDDYLLGLALDAAGNVYVCGFTTSKDFPLKNPIQSVLGNNSDPFVAKISGTVGFSGSVTLFVPIVLSSSGLNSSFYSSELTLTNRGSQDATVQFTYTAAFGGGGGAASIQLPAGQQKITIDAIEFLRSIGVAIPDSGNRAGTLSVRFSGISSADDAAVTVRTTTQVSNGRAGLSYSAFPVSQGLSGPSYLCGLQQNATNRSNVAIQNAGASSDGDVVLRLTVFSGDPASPFSLTLPDETLAPGGFKQYTEILRSVLGPNGLPLTNGYVKVERLNGRARYYAYAVVNDQATADGSFVPPVGEVTYAGAGPGRSLPVILESGAFTSELILTNWNSRPNTLRLSFVADAIQASDSTANFVVELMPGEQRIILNLVQYLREKGIAGIGPPGPTYVGPLFVTVDGRGVEGIFVGARTSAAGAGGRYGLFYVAAPYCLATTQSAWLYGLQQNAENRTNLALVNTGETSDAADVFTIDLFDGITGLKVNTVEGITLGAKHWTQIGAVLTQYAPGVTQGYARVTRTKGTNPFIAYAIVNDGGQPGERTGDGAYVVSSP